jgi:RecJ-like exonuclease
MNRSKITVILIFVALYLMHPICSGEANQLSAQNAPMLAASDTAQMQKIGASPLESARPPRLDKHASRGVNCGACHESAEPTASPKTEKCGACHKMDGKKTEHLQGKPDPHKSHIGELPCEKCHREHRESVLFCNKCHVFDLKVP